MRSASSNDGIGDTVRRLVPDRAGNLALRVASALVLAPLALAVVYLGPPYFDVLVTIVAAVLAWEWARLCGHGAMSRPGYLVIAVATATLVAAGLREYAVAGWIIAAGVMAAVVVAGRETDRRPFWYGLGVLYTTLPCLALVWLREHPAQGRDIVFWLLLVIWATDIGAYVAGRTIGGPKLAPRISPKKTWAGLAGGIVSAGSVGALAGVTLLSGSPIELAWAAAALAVWSQLGDLFESSVKRHFGVKDSSNLIPGHGGLLDRLDGVLAGGLAAAVLIWLMEAPPWP